MAQKGAGSCFWSCWASMGPKQGVLSPTQKILRMLTFPQVRTCRTGPKFQIPQHCSKLLLMATEGCWFMFLELLGLNGTQTRCFEPHSKNPENAHFSSGPDLQNWTQISNSTTLLQIASDGHRRVLVHVSGVAGPQLDPNKVF